MLLGGLILPILMIKKRFSNVSFSVLRNIKNRWSGGAGTQHTSSSVRTSTSLVNSGVGGDEEQALLHVAASDSPFDTPAHKNTKPWEEPPDYSTAALTSKHILVDMAAHTHFQPTSSELKRAINQSIFSPKRIDNDKKETVC